MRDLIAIDKSQMPYNFNILFGAEEFNVEFKYNKMSDLFTCTLSKGGKVLVYDEPLIYGTRLFNDVYNADTYPCIDVVPYDESGTENTVTYNNLGVTVFLTVDNQGG